MLKGNRPLIDKHNDFQAAGGGKSATCDPPAVPQNPRELLQQSPLQEIEEKNDERFLHIDDGALKKLLKNYVHTENFENDANDMCVREIIRKITEEDPQYDPSAPIPPNALLEWAPNWFWAYSLIFVLLFVLFMASQPIPSCSMIFGYLLYTLLWNAFFVDIVHIAGDSPKLLLKTLMFNNLNESFYEYHIKYALHHRLPNNIVKEHFVDTVINIFGWTLPLQMLGTFSWWLLGLAPLTELCILHLMKIMGFILPWWWHQQLHTEEQKQSLIFNVLSKTGLFVTNEQHQKHHMFDSHLRKSSTSQDYVFMINLWNDCLDMVAQNVHPNVLVYIGTGFTMNIDNLVIFKCTSNSDNVISHICLAVIGVCSTILLGKMYKFYIDDTSGISQPSFNSFLDLFTLISVKSK